MWLEEGECGIYHVMSPCCRIICTFQLPLLLLSLEYPYSTDDDDDVDVDYDGDDREICLQAT